MTKEPKLKLLDLDHGFEIIDKDDCYEDDDWVITQIKNLYLYT